MGNKQLDTSIFQNLKRIDPYLDKERSYDISALFTGYSPHLNEYALYFTYYRRMPSLFIEINIDCASAVKALINKYRDGEKNADSITDWYISKVYVRNTREVDDVFLFLKDDILLYFDSQHGQVKILFKHTPIQEVEMLAEETRRFKKKSFSQPQINILFQEDNKLTVKPIDIKKHSLQFADNYNDDFPAVHTIIRKRLSKKRSKGLVLLHGRPDTGKTSYIRYLTGIIKKKFIFLPPGLAQSLTNPELLPVLLRNPDSILVIEDAEDILVDRAGKVNSGVSTLLNLCDGLLSDCLNIQIICSCNIDIKHIDSALLRKGRLIAKYEFKELIMEKAQSLSAKLRFSKTITAPATLAEIYNPNENTYTHNPSIPIGFLN